MGLPAKLSLTSSNYLTHGEPKKVAEANYYKEHADLESLVSGRVSFNLPILEGASLSLDVGAASTIKFNNENNPKENVTTLPYSEIKYKQNFAKVGDFTFRGYGRQRITGKNVQERISAGVSYKVNDKLSLYADGHYTIKVSDNMFDHKAGGWVGVDYNPAKNLNIWVEPVQINRNLNKEYFDNPNDSGWRIASNAGISYKF